MRAKSKEIRELIINKKEAGITNDEISKVLNISVSCVKTIWRLYKKTENIENSYKNCGRKPAVTEDMMKKVTDKIKEQPDITLKELVDEFELNISVSALCRKLKKLGYTLKKRLLLQENN